MAKYIDKEAGLVKPPPALFRLVTKIAQGVLADHVIRTIYSTTVGIEEIEYLEEIKREIELVQNNYEKADMEDFFELIEEFRMEYHEVLRIILNDYEDTPKDEKIKEDASYVMELVEEITRYHDLDFQPYTQKDFEKLRESKRAVLLLVATLSFVTKQLRLKKESVPYKDKDSFDRALSQFPREYLTSSNTFLNLGVKAEVTHEDFIHPIKLSFKFQSSRVLGSHSFSGDLEHDILITMPNKRFYSKKDLDDVEDIVRHELVHAVQHEIASRNYLPDRGGLPFRTKDTRYRQHDLRGESEIRRELENLGIDPDLANFHALDDHEFYTRLLDEVEEFKDHHHRPSNRSIRRYINSRPFFKSLKHFKKKYWDKAVGLFYQAVNEGSEARVARQLIQDLAGVQTWVSKTRQDQIENDTSTPESSRADYQDGKPQRDRVLPLPSGHPKGRDEVRAGPPVSNTPSDSAGSSLNHNTPRNPNAIPNQPDGKPLHQRPRSSGMPGDQYGHPYIDAKNTTGLSRRTFKTALEMDLLEEDDLDYFLEDDGDFSNREGVGRAKINWRKPKTRQREWQGQLKREYKVNRARTKRKNLSKKKQNRKRYYDRNKHLILRYQKRRRENPKQHKRFKGGPSTRAQKNNRSKRAEMMKDTYALVQNVDIFDRMAEEMESSEIMAKPRYKKGPGSRSTSKQQKVRRKRRKLRNSNYTKLRRARKRYYRKNKTKIKKRVKTWRRKHKQRLKRYKPMGKKASMFFEYPYLLECSVGGLPLCVERISPCTSFIILSHQNDESDLYEMPLYDFYWEADWHDEEDEWDFDDFVEEIAKMKRLAKNVPNDPKLWAQIIELAKGERKTPVEKGGVSVSPVRDGEGFQKYPSAYANGWASKAYGDLGGTWSKQASQKDISLPTLQVLLAILRGAHWAHWTSHWQVKGQSYYGDHLLLERIYESLIEEIDTLAEKIVGTYGAMAVAPVEQAQIMANTLLPVAEAQAENDPIRRALVIEEALQVVFKNIYNALKEIDALTLGMDDFLMSMANAHETNLYLLRQRTRG